jgi:hypothetical protein
VSGALCRAPPTFGSVLQIWDDKTSISLPGPLAAYIGSTSGMMGTHDEITRAYFQGSGVNCAVIQRSGGKGNQFADATVASAFFSHHQKCIVCDAPAAAAAGGYRTLVSFVGGLDLTLGMTPTGVQASVLSRLHLQHLLLAMPEYWSCSSNKCGTCCGSVACRGAYLTYTGWGVATKNVQSRSTAEDDAIARTAYHR